MLVRSKSKWDKMKTWERNMQAIVYLLVCGLFLYLFFSLTELDFDFTKWSLFSRIFFPLGTFIWASISFDAYKEEQQSKIGDEK